MPARIHHISIVNRFIRPTFDFYHNILGLKLLMKTINQDDHTMYHQFFGTNTIERTILKVPSEASLHFWEIYFETQGVCHYGIESFSGRPILRFEGLDATQLALVPLREFEDIDDYFPYVTDQIPTEHAILGIDAIQLRVQYSDATERELLSVGW
ncbi:VOC family protein [Enterococcus faecium]|nr:VOC family protein [Enterococcus faecium]NVF19821.1 VOC family protein [Enterococcus faecium]